MLIDCVARDFKTENIIKIHIGLLVKISFIALRKCIFPVVFGKLEILGTLAKIKNAAKIPKTEVIESVFALKYSTKNEEIIGPKENPIVPMARKILIFLVNSLGFEQIFIKLVA